MSKRFFSIILELIAGIAGNLIAGWIQQDKWSNLFTLPRLLGTVSAVIVVIIVLAWLETSQYNPVTLRWNRFWYLLDFLTRWSNEQYLPIGFRLKGESKPFFKGFIPSQGYDVVLFLKEVLINNKNSTYRFIVTGESGCGKSTALRHLSLEIACNAFRNNILGKNTPIWVALASYSGEKLIDYINTQLVSWGRNGKTLAQILPALLERGNAILLFDGIDEAFAVNTSKIFMEVSEILNNYPKISIIITSRIQAANNYLLKEFVQIEIQEIADSELYRFIKYFSPSTEDIESVKNWLNSFGLLAQKGIGRNPLWLSLILTGFGSYHDSLREGQLLINAIENLLRREWDEKPGAKRDWERVLPRNEQIKETQDALAKLAYDMIDNNLQSMERDVALSKMFHWIKARVGIDALRPQDILTLGYDAQILTFESRSILFRHRLLQEMLASIELDRIVNEKEVAKYINDLRWWEVIILLSDVLCESRKLELYQRYENILKLIIFSDTDERKLVLAAGMLQRCNYSEYKEIVLQGLVEALKCGVSPIIRQACIDLALVLDGNRVKFLETLLESPSLDVQRVVIDILGSIRTDYSINLLIHQLKFSTVSNDAVIALASIGSIAVDNLINFLREESNNEVQISIIKCFGLIGDNRSIIQLISLFDKDDWEIRACASKALCQIGKNSIEPLLNSLRNEQAIEILAVVAETLLGYGKEAFNVLVENLSISSRFEIQVVCAWTLWQLGELAAKPLSRVLEMLDITQFGTTYKDKLPMRVIGTMIPIYQRSPDQFRVVWRNLSPKASDLVGRVLRDRNYDELNRRLLAEYTMRHPEYMETAKALRKYIDELTKNGEYGHDTSFYTYASFGALKFSDELTYFSNKIRSQSCNLFLEESDSCI